MIISGSLNSITARRVRPRRNFVDQSQLYRHIRRPATLLACDAVVAAVRLEAMLFYCIPQATAAILGPGFLARR
jgi:hypothetical protein